MKKLVLIAYFLAISYASDPTKLKKLFDTYIDCLQELNVPGYTPEVILCSLQKYELIDEQGLIKKDELFRNFDDLISDKDKLYTATQAASICLEQAKQDSSKNNDEKTMTVIKCGKPIIALFDKFP
ncbi:uncharacterized protein [Anoplolepis gracilipes]|uniref:uncharacterized protein isoform X2 n=1 Tax=Anoplolepis gracilipes TaxID=354296 RepID=UPI003BA240DF